MLTVSHIVRDLFDVRYRVAGLLTLNIILLDIVAELDGAVGVYNRTASFGSTATLPCPMSDGDWFYVQTQSSITAGQQTQQHRLQVTRGSQVVAGLEDKFSLKFRVYETGAQMQLLRVHDVQVEDVGLYSCENQHGQQTKFRLQVPCFTLTKCEGQNVSLQCHSTSPGTSVVWRYSKTIADRKDVVFSMGKFFVKDRHRMHVRSSAADGGHYNLIIQNTTVGDSGFYGCTENGGFGPGDVCTILTVEPSSNCSTQHDTRKDRQQDEPDHRRPTPSVNGNDYYSSASERHEDCVVTMKIVTVLTVTILFL